MVMLVDGTNVDGYCGVQSGCGFWEQNAYYERLLELCGAVELIVANMCFKSIRIYWPPLYLVA